MENGGSLPKPFVQLLPLSPNPLILTHSVGSPPPIWEYVSILYWAKNVHKMFVTMFLTLFITLFVTLFVTMFITCSKLGTIAGRHG